MKRRAAFWLAFAVAQGLYLVMTQWSLPRIAAEAGGLAPFDMRPMGYSLDEARAFLAAMSDTGREFYLGTQHRLDLAYPAVLALMLALGMSLLFQRQALLALLPVALGVLWFDYMENQAVSAMLQMAPEAVDAARVATASGWTILKSFATMLGYLALLSGVARMLWRSRAGRGA